MRSLQCKPSSGLLAPCSPDDDDDDDDEDEDEDEYGDGDDDTVAVKGEMSTLIWEDYSLI